MIRMTPYLTRTIAMMALTTTLFAAAAWADTKIYAGALCKPREARNEPNIQRDIDTGGLITRSNVEVLCPIIRDRESGGPQRITINFGTVRQDVIGKCFVAAYPPDGDDSDTNRVDVLFGSNPPNESPEGLNQVTIDDLDGIPDGAYSMLCLMPSGSTLVQYAVTE